MAIKFGVSFYSYQTAFGSGRMNIEDCVKNVVKIGADGVELLPIQTPVGGYPTATEAEVYTWRALMDQYGTKPVCLDSVIRPGDCGYDKQLELMRSEIRYAHRFGFSIMRTPVLYGIDMRAVEECLPLAGELGLNLCLEIHVPMKIQGPLVAAYIDMIERTGAKNAGLIPDMAIFTRSLPRRLVNKSVREGGDRELIGRIVSAYESREDMDALVEKIRAKTADKRVLDVMNCAVRTVPNEPEELRDIAKYIAHFHGKFYDVDETFVEHGIRYEETMRILKEIGYDGYICSEFEGQRMYCGDETLDEAEQVRRHHVMMRKLLEL